MSLNGLILISQALDYTGSTPEYDNLIAFVTYLPTMAATAWYHGKVKDRPADLEKFLNDARHFASADFATALFQGSRLDPEGRARVKERLAYFTGLSPEYLERSDLQVLADRFRKELLREKGLSIGRLDGRYTGDDIDDTSDSPEGDPSAYGIDGAYTAVFHHYISHELGVDMDREHQVSGGTELGKNWN